MRTQGMGAHVYPPGKKDKLDWGGLAGVYVYVKSRNQLHVFANMFIPGLRINLMRHLRAFVNMLIPPADHQLLILIAPCRA
eukprot:1160222-Pelagomonas_calceolata.AAC.7